MTKSHYDNNKKKKLILNESKINSVSSMSLSQGTNNEPLTIVETFVGCGGSHIGFARQNFNTIFVNDCWDEALETLSNNNPNLQKKQIICEDINDLCKKDLLTQYNIKAGELSVLIGGVVCKGFSLAGVRNPYDDRNYLYISQLKLVEQFRPKISIIENVPGMQNMKILCKNNYAPTSNKIKFNVTESIENICSTINNVIEDSKKNIGSIIALNKEISKGTNVEELSAKKDGLIEKKNKLDEERKNLEKTLSKYMYSVVDDIVAKYEELDYKVYIKKMKVSEYGGYTNRVRLIIVAVTKDIDKDWVWPEITNSDSDESLPNLNTVKDAFDLLDNKINDQNIDIDNRPMNHKKNTIEKFKKISCNSKTDGYSSRGTSQRLDANKPAPTLVPGHSSFQIHPTEHRSITVREGATISGFPIDYNFVGSHSTRCIQIGNAIPIQLGEALAKSAKNLLI